MYVFYGFFFVIILEMLLCNVVGGVMVLINSMGVLGFFCGLWFVGYLNGVIGSFVVFYIFMGVVFFVLVWLILIVKFVNN